MQTSTLFKTGYNYFLYTAVIIVIASFFTHRMNDFHWHDTYIVISDKIVFWLLAAVLLFIWLMHYFMRNVLLAKWLTWLHVIATIVFTIAFFTANIWYNQLLTKRQVRFYNDFEEDNKQVAVVMLPLIIFFLAGQLAFFINTIGGCIKYLVNKTGKEVQFLYRLKNNYAAYKAPFRGWGAVTPSPDIVQTAS